jgi:hypothetical protein
MLGNPPHVHFDPLLRANTPSLKQALVTLAEHLESLEKPLGLRERSRKGIDRPKFRTAIEALGCNLSRLAIDAPGRALIVPRSNGTLWARGRYAVAAYGQHFRDALAIMAHPRVALIDDVRTGWQSRATGTAQRSTIRPTPALLDLCPSMEGWQEYRREEEAEVLVLKGPKDEHGHARAIEYRDTGKTTRWREEMRAINAHLQTAPIMIAAPPGFLGLNEDGQPLDPNRRALRRIFNDGRWDHGGRLYDGFWETMPKAQRCGLLRIGTKAKPEGEPIAHVDFNQLFPRLAYRLANAPAPAGDLYDIGEVGSRAGWKKLMNAMLFADGQTTYWPRECRVYFRPGTKLRDAVAALTAKHAPIAPLFGTGIGSRLMFTESQILVTALLALHRLGITALPLHDSVIVAASEAETARGVLRDSYQRHTGDARAAISIE